MLTLFLKKMIPVMVNQDKYLSSRYTQTVGPSENRGEQRGLITPFLKIILRWGKPSQDEPVIAHCLWRDDQLYNHKMG